MPRTRRFQNNFTTGEVSPDLHERYDFQKRENALATMRNCLLRPQGGALKRPGSRFVTTTKNNLGAASVRLIPFIFSRLQAYVLEFGNFYIRFYRDNGQLLNAGIPVEVTTPWSITQVQALDFAQDADTMVIVHPDTEPMILSRFSDINWKLNPLNARPVPTEPVGHTDPTATVTITLFSGNTYTVSSTVAIFTNADVGRTFVEQGENATGRGVISTYVSSTEVRIELLEAFSSTTLTIDPDGESEWLIELSPLANLGILTTKDGEKAEGTKGELVTLSAYKSNDSASLLTNSTFSSGLTGWSNLSGRLIHSTTYDGGGGTELQTSDDLRAEGVQPNHLVVNVTSSPDQEGLISFIGNNTALGTNPNNTATIVGDEIAFATNDVIEIRDTGRVKEVSISGDAGIEFLPGENGIAQIRQSFPVTAFHAYEFEVEVFDNSLAIKVGNTITGDNVLSERTLTPGVHKGVFFAPANTVLCWFTITNNQFNTSATCLKAIVRDVTADAFAYQVDKGDFIRLNNGYFEATSDGAVNLVQGVIIKELDDTDDVLAGAWTAEKSQWRDSFPSHVAFYQQRLLLTWGLRIGGSAVGDFRSFALGASSSDAFVFRPAATEVNPPLWTIGEQSLIIGTRGEEFVVAGTDTGFISPIDINAFSPSAEGSDEVKPQRAVDVTLFVKAGGKRVIEFRYVPGTVEPVTRDLTILAEHLIVQGDRIVQIAWQKEPEQILWCLTSNGKLFSLSYIRSQDIWAWARHDSEDSPLYKSVAVIPHPDGDRDQVWILVNRGVGLQEYIEYLDDEQGLFPELPFTMADAVARYSGVSTSTITGLGYLEGKSNVFVIDEDGVQGPLTVSGGSVTFQREVTEADVGILFTPELETLRPSIEGQSSTGLIIGNTNLFARFRLTGTGVEANGKLLKRRGASELMDSRIAPLTGELEIPSLGHDRAATVNIKQTIPETFHVLSIAGTIDFENP